MDPVQLLDKFSHLLAGAMKASVITKDHLETTNRTALNETHSLILTLLIQAALEIKRDRHEMVGVEHGLKAASKRAFRPDVTIWGSDKGRRRLDGVVEYESPNSGDKRIWSKDIEHYHSFVKSPENPSQSPKWWMIMTTLPDHEISRTAWKSWAFAKSTRNFARMILNPADFWYAQYKRKFDLHKACCLPRCYMLMANLTYSRIEVKLSSKKANSGLVWGA